MESSSIYNTAYIKKHAINHVVATAKQLWYLEGVKSTDSTKLTNVIQVDLGGFIPYQLVSRSAVGFLNDYIVERKHFSR